MPFLIYCESIANGRAQILAQPIPATAIIAATVILLLDKAIPKYASIIVNKETIWTFLFPNLADKIPIGIATRKQTRLNIAKQIEEKFVPPTVAFSKALVISSVAALKSGTPNTV